MRKVIVETPFKAKNQADQERNRRYLFDAMRDCFIRDEAPFASHRLYTECLDDGDPAERSLGIEAGLVWGACADATVVYDDLGISSGMVLGIKRAQEQGRPVEYRYLAGWEKERAATRTTQLEKTTEMVHQDP